MDIIQYLLSLFNTNTNKSAGFKFYLQIYPLKQWAFDDSHSPKYQKFKVDELPVIKTFVKQDYVSFTEYYTWKYHKSLKPVQRRKWKIHS